MSYMTYYSEETEWNSEQVEDIKDYLALVKDEKIKKSQVNTKHKEIKMEDHFKNENWNEKWMELMKKEFVKEFEPQTKEYNQKYHRVLDYHAALPESFYLSCLTQSTSVIRYKNEDKDAFMKRVRQEQLDIEFYSWYENELKLNPIKINEIG